jgi:hypothetical protein
MSVPIELLEDLNRHQWGCTGTHMGRGTPECPRDRHHHHDNRCIPGLISLIREIHDYLEEPVEQIGTAEWCMEIDNNRMLALRATQAALGESTEN